jgi:hypothetical protein
MTDPTTRTRWQRILVAAAAAAILVPQSLSAQGAVRMGDHEELASETYCARPR